MKTIKINGVELRVTQDVSETTSYPVQRLGATNVDRVFSTHQKICAAAPGIDVSIIGDSEALRKILAEPSDPHSLIQCALSALGYVVGDHEKDVAQFSQWVDGLAEFQQSDEALELWTKSVLALLPSAKSIEGASLDARDIVVHRMRLFPPAPDTGWQKPEPWAELDQWRSAAKSCGFDSPKDLAGAMHESFGQFVDRKITKEWQEATGCMTATGAGERYKQLRAGYDSANTELAQLKREVKDAKQREQAWVNATGRQCPGDAEQRIEFLQTKIQMQASTIAASDEALIHAHAQNNELTKEIHAWQKASGLKSPEQLINATGTSQTSWREVTGCPDAFQAQKKIAELESKLLSYASEIDALRKTSQQQSVLLNDSSARSVIGISADARELAKVRAELQSKCREAQTEKERADKAEQNTRHVAVIVDKVREALGIVGADDSDLPEHVADLKKAKRDNAATVDELRKILHAKEGENIIDAAKRAIVPLPKPEKVEPGQKWAFVMKAVEVQSGWDQSPSTVGQFIDASGNPYSAFAEDVSTGFYLGT